MVIVVVVVVIVVVVVVVESPRFKIWVRVIVIVQESQSEWKSDVNSGELFAKQGLFRRSLCNSASGSKCNLSGMMKLRAEMVKI